jgi:hypothetical protein
VHWRAQGAKSDFLPLNTLVHHVYEAPHGPGSKARNAANLQLQRAAILSEQVVGRSTEGNNMPCVRFVPQAVRHHVFRDEGYKQRCRTEVVRLQRLLESETRTKAQVPKLKPMAEPTYEELKARVAELEKQKSIGSLSFRVSAKGGISVYGLGRFPTA